MNLTGKQNRFLRAKAQTIKPIFQIGKDGITPNMVHTIGDALEAHELIKVSILQNFSGTKQEAAQELAEQTHAALVQLIGKTIVLYRPSATKPTIQLPKK
ncbi:MAG: ribosome assembly RNA-binding protein YhbY [Culicoidibacterales bacterium]